MAPYMLHGPAQRTRRLNRRLTNIATRIFRGARRGQALRQAHKANTK